MELGVAGWAVNRSILRDKSLTLLQLPALVRDEFGVGIVELVSTFFESQSAKYLNELRLEIERHRLKVVNIAVDTGYVATSDEGARRVDIETVKQWIHVARALGSAAIRVNTGDGGGDPVGALARAVAGYRELAAHGAESGVRVLIENHGGISSDPGTLKQLLTQVDTPWFGTCPDLGNFPGSSWEAGMKVMAPRAQSVHVKIAGYEKSGAQKQQTRDGSTREFDVARSLRILKEAGYEGPLCFEGNSAEDDERVGMKKGLAYVRELLATL